MGKWVALGCLVAAVAFAVTWRSNVDQWLEDGFNSVGRSA